jgi:hypothetical protein
MFYKKVFFFNFISRKNINGVGETNLVDDEIHVARRDHLPIEQVPLVTNAADGPAGGLDGHHLLHHFLFVRIEEARKLGGVERRVQLEETAERRHGCLCAYVGEEEREVALGGFRWRIFRVRRQLILVLVRRGVGGDEFWACIEEELFECREAFVADRCKRLLTTPMTMHKWETQERTHPLDSLANWSPYLSLAMLRMLSSNRLGERALQTANNAYIRSAVLLI